MRRGDLRQLARVLRPRLVRRLAAIASLLLCARIFGRSMPAAGVALFSAATFGAVAIVDRPTQVASTRKCDEARADDAHRFWRAALHQQPLRWPRRVFGQRAATRVLVLSG